MSDELKVVGNKDLANDGGKGFFQDAEGNFSSGRFIKVLSALMAFVTAIAGTITLIASPTNAAISDYCFKMTGLFLATATGAEIVQKVTGK